MPRTPVSLAKARAAKEKAVTRFSRFGEVVGVGITKVAGSYGVKINLRCRSDAPALPKTIDGVPVRVEVVGTIRRRTAG